MVSGIVPRGGVHVDLWVNGSLAFPFLFLKKYVSFILLSNLEKACVILPLSIVPGWGMNF